MEENHLSGGHRYINQSELRQSSTLQGKRHPFHQLRLLIPVGVASFLTVYIVILFFYYRRKVSKTEEHPPPPEGFGSTTSASSDDYVVRQRTTQLHFVKSQLSGGELYHRPSAARNSMPSKADNSWQTQIKSGNWQAPDSEGRLRPNSPNI